jgi:predicted DsbA family dithiol-disulfide isomerase
VSLAFRMALANDHITATAVEVSEYSDLIQKYRVNGVPKTVVDDRIEILGGLPEDAFVAEALRERLPAS